MIKEIEYKTFKFKIEVKLNSRVEKRINGSRWHTISVSDLHYRKDTSYYETTSVLDKNLEEGVLEMERKVKEDVDNYIKMINSNGYDERLERLGFKMKE